VTKRGFTVGLIAIATVAGTALAATAAQVVAARQQNYKQIGKATKGIMDELKKPSPSIAAIRGDAKTIDRLARRVPGWFPKGSGAEAGVKTAALPVIWQQPADFRAAAVRLAAAARALDAAAAKGDIAQVRGAASGLGGACKNCHQTFKAKD
jgi:cytochrome c556